MTQIVAEVVGADIAALLNQLAIDFGPRNAATTLNQPVRNAMRPWVREISQNTPIDTGGLRQSIGRRVGRPSNRRVATSGAVDRFTGVEGRAGWFRRENPSVTWDQMLAVEFGAQGRPGQRVLRNAFASGRRRAIRIFATEAGARMTRRGRQLGRRQRRGRLRFR